MYRKRENCNCHYCKLTLLKTDLLKSIRDIDYLIFKDFAIGDCVDCYDIQGVYCKKCEKKNWKSNCARCRKCDDEI